MEQKKRLVTRSDFDGLACAMMLKELDLIAFAVPLKEVAFQKGETYHAVITGNMPTGDSFVVKDFSFTNG